MVIPPIRPLGLDPTLDGVTTETAAGAGGKQRVVGVAGSFSQPDA